MPERWRSSAARDLVAAVRKAGGSVERAGRGRIKVTGPAGEITIQEPAGESRRDLRRGSAAGKIAEATGLDLDRLRLFRPLPLDDVAAPSALTPRPQEATMAYVRDPYDTDEPPCVCGLSGPARTTEEFCPAHGDSGKSFPLPEYDEPGVAYGEPPAGCSCPCHDETQSPICMTCCDGR